MISFEGQSWIILPLILPLAAGLFCFLSRRWAFALSLTAALGNLLSIGVLLNQFLDTGPLTYNVGNWKTPLGIALRIDGPSILMLLMTAVTGLGITLYARGYFAFRIAVPKRIGRHERQERFFWPLWMTLWASLNGLFLSADIFNMYVTLELISIPAVALAALSGKPASQIAAFRYLLVSLLGSLSYLLGVVFVYKTYGVLDLVLLSGKTASGAGMAALALMSVGLLLKTALFPMHFWLPPAHANALAPVSAILSSLVVKGSFYLLFRLWFDVFASAVTEPMVNILGTLGAGAIVWGALQAIRQKRLKLLVAYSTVSQLGYLFIAFPLAYLDMGTHWGTVAFMVLAHACAKSAMFMASGTIFLHAGHDRINDLAGVRSYIPVTVFAYAIAGVNIMGLPPSGGFIAKWLLISSSINSSQWWWGIIVMIGSLLASVYIFRVVSRFFVIPEGYKVPDRRPHSPLLEWPALVLALIALLLGLIAPYPLHILETGNSLFSMVSPKGLPL
ncbi:MAG: oxidoreductase [Desulfobulbaceae bacterium]|uniref:Oxidoreductase n=1 Tax=Candidatus Desulfobia pelagia TaxID=2841692 RepID=A0A8J6NEY9_9BACT|nr:oxidoreductase [Candidatus Desulfobia pelagia]